MTATIIPFVSREQWLAERVHDITSTEVAALFGLSPYVTEFELWHQKRDGIVVDFEPSARMKWGTRLQDVIAHGVAEDMGWKVERLDAYMRDEQDRIGSSFDFACDYATAAGPMRGIMEIKNVDRFIFRDEWIDNDRGIEAPQHIELQVQHQLEVSGLDWCALVALVGGNEAKATVRLPDRDIGREIRTRSRAFWASIAANKPPKPDYERDAEFMAKLYGKADAGVVADADAETAALLDEYARLGEIASKRDALKAQVLERIGVASKVRAQHGTLSCGMVEPSPGKLVTPEMVGTYVGARSGFRQFRFTPKKEK